MIGRIGKIGNLENREIGKSENLENPFRRIGLINRVIRKDRENPINRKRSEDRKIGESGKSGNPRVYRPWPGVY